LTAFLDALEGLVDYGTAWANKAGAVTVPARAREALGLDSAADWHVFGAPPLGVAILVGPRRSARASLAAVLGTEPASGRSVRPENESAST
jgi:hypothetical protein